MRRSGILLPISSLHSKYGIGTFSKSAYEFIDFLEKSGQSYWQILPLGPTGHGDSPYQSFSTFAGNPYFIDLDQLVKLGYLTEEDCKEADVSEKDNAIDYEKVYLTRFKVLKKAFLNSNIEKEPKFQCFIKENREWLDDYAFYMAVKNFFHGVSWLEWDEDIKMRHSKAMENYREELKEEILFYQFQQFLFDNQWKALKKYANRKQIEIIGDIPIYVALDSADTWANPELFQFDKKGIPIAVAGCPPDAFSKTGQLWGNPLYKWEYHKATDYNWWIKRLSYSFRLYDVVRIDHFRGFDEYYSVPYGNKTAELGEWRTGPSYDIFDALKKALGEKKIIAEDLGYLTDSVLELVKQTGFPGMKILQFAFDSREESDYLPHNYIKNCVVYTGTHDNDTIRGWYETVAKEDRRFAKKYLNISDESQIEWDFIRAAFASVADTVIIPMQDYLGLDSEGRINIPSTLGGNWKWRIQDKAFTKELAEKIADLTKLYSRLYNNKSKK